MRVLRGVAHVVDIQEVVNFSSQKELSFTTKNSSFEQLGESVSGNCAVISIESKWVGSHIKLSYDLKQNVTKVKTQFDMAVNPL